MMAMHSPGAAWPLTECSSRFVVGTDESFVPSTATCKRGRGPGGRMFTQRAARPDRPPATRCAAVGRTSTTRSSHLQSAHAKSDAMPGRGHATRRLACVPDVERKRAGA
jgi:hypothetical protein